MEMYSLAFSSPSHFTSHKSLLTLSSWLLCQRARLDEQGRARRDRSPRLISSSPPASQRPPWLVDEWRASSIVDELVWVGGCDGFFVFLLSSSFVLSLFQTAHSTLSFQFLHGGYKYIFFLLPNTLNYILQCFIRWESWGWWCM